MYNRFRLSKDKSWCFIYVNIGRTIEFMIDTGAGWHCSRHQRERLAI